MTDLIIIVLLVILLICGIRESIKHFKGESGCCGSSAYKPKKKKLKNKIVSSKQIYVENMKCQNCANKIMSAVNEMQGASATINLNKKLVKVQCDRNIDVKSIEQLINKLGYKTSVIK